MTPFGSPRALYIHVPFCPVICPYCDFHKMRRNEALVAAYLARLEEEAASLHAVYGHTLDTIYLGGGTPSHLTDAELERVAGLVGRLWGWPGRVETTIEADPLTFDAARAARFASLGFSRVSVGLQSTSPAALRFLGRAHSPASGLEAVEAAARSGCHVSADLIAAVPRTAAPERDIVCEIDEALAAGAGHVSVYSLTVEPHTPFAFAAIEVDADLDADEFDLVHDALVERGLRHYEVSNYARAGHESAHNLTYWRGEPYLALGPGATAFLPTPDVGGPAPDAGDPGPDAGGRGPNAPFRLGVRRTAPLMKGWLARNEPVTGGPPSPVTGEAVEVTPRRWVEDTLMTALRTDEGVSLPAMSERAGADEVAAYGPGIEALVARGLLVRQDERVRANRDGLRRLNSLLVELFDGRDRGGVEPAAAWR